jgi:hypothetical protein
MMVPPSTMRSRTGQRQIRCPWTFPVPIFLIRSATKRGRPGLKCRRTLGELLGDANTEMFRPRPRQPPAGIDGHRQAFSSQTVAAAIQAVPLLRMTTHVASLLRASHCQ